MGEFEELPPFLMKIPKSPQPLWYLTLALMPGTGTSWKGERVPLFNGDLCITRRCEES